MGWKYVLICCVARRKCQTGFVLCHLRNVISCERQGSLVTGCGLGASCSIPDGNTERGLPLGQPQPSGNQVKAAEA
jgi:hypothetical protein